MAKEIRDNVLQIRLSNTEKLKIFLLSKLLRVKKAEAIRQAVQKMLAEESMRKLQK